MITISQVLRSSLWKWAHRPTMSLKWTGMTFIGGNKSIFKSLLLCICLMSQSAAQIIRTTVHTVQGQNFIDVCRRLFVFSHDVWRSHVFSPWCTDLGWDKGCWYIAHFYSLDEPWDVPRHRLSLRHFKDKVGLLSVHCMNTNVFPTFIHFSPHWYLDPTKKSLETFLPTQWRWRQTNCVSSYLVSATDGTKVGSRPLS